MIGQCMHACLEQLTDSVSTVPLQV